MYVHSNNNSINQECKASMHMHRLSRCLTLEHFPHSFPQGEYQGYWVSQDNLLISLLKMKKVGPWHLTLGSTLSISWELLDSGMCTIRQQHLTIYYYTV